MDFVLTSDLDWASEYCIEHFLRNADRFSVKPTLFVTHESPAANEAFRNGRADLQIHPNFLPGSSHGADVNAVMHHVRSLVPDAIAVRTHRYIDGTAIQTAFARHGLKIDSNVCHHLQRDLRPVLLPSGLTRLPVFFEDDFHWTRKLAWDFDTYAEDFFSAGLKILNFHPFFVALNIPDAEFYAHQKRHIPSLTREQAARLRHPGAGTESFLIAMLEAVLAAGHRFISMRELAEQLGCGAS